MTTTDLPYPPSLNKVISSKARSTYKISLHDRPILSLALDKRQKGGQRLGKQRRIRGFYIDSDNRIYAEYAVNDAFGSFYQYAIIGRLHVLEEEEAGV